MFLYSSSPPHIIQSNSLQLLQSNINYILTCGQTYLRYEIDFSNFKYYADDKTFMNCV